MDLIKKNKKTFLIGAGIYAVLFFLIVWTTNLEEINAWFGKALLFLRPLLIGLVLAYICNPFFRLYERRLFVNIKPLALRRGISITLSYLSLLAIIATLLLLILPQLVGSVVEFLTNFEGNLQNTIDDLNKIIIKLNGILPAKNGTSGLIPLIQIDSLQTVANNLLQSLDLEKLDLETLLSPDRLKDIFAFAGNVLSVLTDTLLGFFISLYLLLSKEKRYAQIMRARAAIFSEGVNRTITDLISTFERSFGGFFRGKLIDSAIVGVLIYIVLSLFGIPYSILFATIIAITDIIPVIGPFIGVIPSAIIIFLTDPSKLIPFLITVLVVQQIDGNIIAPKILGEQTGVSSLCVIIAITTMGTLWGFVGMLLGVPLFAAILEIGSKVLDKRLTEKGLPSETEYYATDTPPHDEDDNQKSKGKRKRGAKPRHGSLTAEEKQQLNAYALAQKHRLFSDAPDEVLNRFTPTEQEISSDLNKTE